MDSMVQEDSVEFQFQVLKPFNSGRNKRKIWNLAIMSLSLPFGRKKYNLVQYFQGVLAYYKIRGNYCLSKDSTPQNQSEI